MSRFSSCCACLLVSAGFAWGSAFSILEIGARATGMGGAFVAVASDGSALYYNPAGIAFQDGVRMQMDLTLVHGNFKFTPSSTPNGTVVPEDGYQGFIRPKILALPNMYMTMRLKPLAGPEVFAELFPEQKSSATFPTPATYAVGVATEAFGRNLFAADVQMQDYRRLRYVVLNFSQNPPATATPAEVRLDYSFHNAWEVRVGWERPVKSMTVRAGWAFDGTPVPEKSVSPLWPDSSRLNFNVGASKLIGGRELSIFYQFTKFLPRTTNIPANANLFTNGDWNSTAQLLGIALRFRKGGGSLEFNQ